MSNRHRNNIFDEDPTLSAPRPQLSLSIPAANNGTTLSPATTPTAATPLTPSITPTNGTAVDAHAQRQPGGEKAANGNGKCANGHRLNSLGATIQDNSSGSAAATPPTSAGPGGGSSTGTSNVKKSKSVCGRGF